MVSPVKLGIALTLAAPLLTAVPASGTHEVPTSCQGVLQGAGDSGTLTKTIRSVVTNADGSTTVRFRYTSDRGAGEFRLRDCAFIDANANGTYDAGDTIIAGTDFKGRPSSGWGKITISHPLAEGTQLCDRLALSGTSGGTGFTDKSNIACVVIGDGGYPGPDPY